ncbi:MAG TPA: fumarylacetoacetate hydrolase family protein [Bryobacteraceae bacterium]|nr:fumarylacetoacetate hydrolase family protein [Bryobacteraceae bacterium]
MTSASELLAQARINHQRLTELPAAIRPATPGEAYAVQDSLIDHLIAHYGGSVMGYKVACTNVTAQRQLNVDAPFCGRLLSAFFFESLFESPARVDASKFFMRVVEAEFAFEMARDLPPAATPRSRQEIAAAVKGVLPGIEIVDSRFDDWTTIGAPSLIADNACNAAWVKGSVMTDWQKIDLAAQAVRLTVNGKLLREGTGSNVLGHPLNALEWLVNNLSARGLGLKAGQYVTTGVTTEVYMAERGDRITADFGPVGSVQLEFG